MIGLAALAAATTLAAPAAAQIAAERPATAAGCDGTDCRITLTPAQLLAAADRLVAQGRYAQARPLLQALELAPGYKLQTRFLLGYIASKTGDLEGAAERYRAILADDPRQTRVRLELGRVLLQQNKTASADRQFSLAAQDTELPQEIARTIRTVRDTIRSSRTWRLDVNLGVAPDTNINNATSARSVTILLGDTEIPVDLNDQATARSGIGVVGQLSAGLRLPVSARVSALAEFDAIGTEYKRSMFDDHIVQGAAGAEYRFSSATSVSLQGVAAHRWFGGEAVSRQLGARLGGQTVANAKDRFGFQLDVRHSRALFDRAYDGWQGGLYGTYERAVTPTIVASVGPFVRRDALREEPFSNTEAGGNVGVGGELRYGVNFGASLGVSRAVYDAPLEIFDLDARRDWRVVARATLGYRKIRVLGFSPQLVFNYTRINSSLRFYDTTRSRFEFTLARFF
ncbi:surface lipoprotein assembly modifier [uncultured Sphingomonas sp.]|uniref:surface lipoprotein assembly modifier n=1 Tax=uncultured Sphingomonas sp. TaxID=158754 RepID=UPI0035CA45EA